MYPPLSPTRSSVPVAGKTSGTNTETLRSSAGGAPPKRTGCTPVNDVYQRQALRSALEAAQVTTLEPLMFVEISAPEANLGPAISLFGTRGGKVENILDHAGLKLVQGLAPLSKLFGFSTDLRSATQGRAGLMMRFERFDVI